MLIGCGGIVNINQVLCRFITAVAYGETCHGVKGRRGREFIKTDVIDVLCEETIILRTADLYLAHQDTLTGALQCCCFMNMDSSETYILHYQGW